MTKKDNRKIKLIAWTRPSKCQSTEIFDPNGLAPTLCRVDYKSPRKIIEWRNKMDKKVIDDNFTKIDENRYVTTDKEKKNCYSVSTKIRHAPLRRKQENFVLEKPLKIRETTKKGYKEAYPNDGVLTNRGNRKIAKGIVRDNECGCLQTAGVWGTVSPDYRIRKLTPKECERLQGFPDDWTRFGKDGEEISDTQRYKCVGNAVTTTVITCIINEMFGDYIEDKEID